MASSLPISNANPAQQPPSSQIEPAANGTAGSIRAERRAAIREGAAGGVMAAFGSPVEGVTLTHVELLDRSNTGLGLRSPVPVEIGSRFALYPGLARVPATAGTVARCEPEGDEFRIGLRCDPRRAA